MTDTITIDRLASARALVESPLVDPIITTSVRTAIYVGEDTRKGDPFTSAGARKVMAKVLEDCPAYIPGASLSTIAACDVAAMIDLIVANCPEVDIDDAHIGRVQVIWRRKAAQSAGLVTCGTLKPVGKRERLLWQSDAPCPWWRLTLALDVWCLMTDAERWRLVHHELMHATYKGDGLAAPAGRGHDIEEFAATVARYGLADKGHAEFIGQVMARAEIVEELRTWGIDPATGQGLLFADMAPAGVG